jgi:RNA polymerase sigma factor (sigma-70 family)
VKVDLDAVRANDPAALKDLLRAVKKSARAGCNRLGAERLADDVSQELFMLFIRDLIDKFDPSYNLEPYLIQSAVNVARTMLRKQKEIVMEDEELRNHQHNDINTGNGINEDVPVLPHEQQKALEKIRMAFPGIVEVAPSQRSVNSKQVAEFVKERKPPQRKLSESCERLRNIRIELAIPQEEFANRLGIPTTTLLSYEYGRTTNVPSRVMEEAERIHIQEKSVARSNASLERQPMSAIVAEWARKLGVDPDDTHSIAEAIGVANSTVHRWLHGGMRPRPRELGGYMRQVELMARRLEKVVL